MKYINKLTNQEKIKIIADVFGEKFITKYLINAEDVSGIISCEDYDFFKNHFDKEKINGSSNQFFFWSCWPIRGSIMILDNILFSDYDVALGISKGNPNTYTVENLTENEQEFVNQYTKLLRKALRAYMREKFKSYDIDCNAYNRNKRDREERINNNLKLIEKNNKKILELEKENERLLEENENIQDEIETEMGYGG